MDIVTGVGVLDKAMTILGAIESGPQTLGELQAATGPAPGDGPPSGCGPGDARAAAP